MGKVIGRNGSVAKAMRTLLKVVSTREGGRSRWRSSRPRLPMTDRRATVTRAARSSGLVRGLHGLRGAVRVEVLSDDPRRFARGSVLHPEGERPSR